MDKFISDFSPCPQCETILVPKFNIIKNHYRLEHGREPSAWEVLQLKMYRNRMLSLKEN